MPRIVQQLRTATSNNPPVAGSLLPGQLSVEMGSPARLWVGVDAALDATQQKLLIDTSVKGGVTTGDTPPANPNPGDLWWDSTGGNLFVRYADPNSTQWVIANTGGGGGASMTEPVGAGTWGRLETGAWQRSVAVVGDVMTGPLTLSGSSTRLILDGPAGTSRDMAFRIGGQDRWLFHSDAGNDFALLRFLGSASYDSVMFADYATGAVQFGTALNPGSVNVRGPLTVAANAVQPLEVVPLQQLNAAIAAGPYVLKVGDVMSGGLAIAPPAGWPTLKLDKIGGTGAQIQGAQGNLTRWTIEPGNGLAETGGNTGSNFAISRYNDAGVYVDTPFYIDRASGWVVTRNITDNQGGRYISTAAGNPCYALHVPGVYATGFWLDVSGLMYFGQCDGAGSPTAGWGYMSASGTSITGWLSATGRITGNAGVAFNAGGDYVAYDDGTNRIFQFAGGYYEAYNIALGQRTWVGNNAAIMTLDWGGNLWVNLTVNANSIVSRSGIFEILPNYYMGRNSLDGRWMFTENGIENFTINTAGRATARIAMTPSVGRNCEFYCSGAYSAINWDVQYNFFWSNATAVMSHGSPLGSPWNCYNNGQTVQGGPCYATAYPGPSDAAMKTNVQPWAAGLAEILQISPVSYQWAEGTHLGTPGKTYYGVTAQDVQVAIPEAVGTFEHQLGFIPPKTPEEAADWPDPEPVTMLAVESATIFYAAVNAIKELHALITGLTARLDAAGVA
jgi:hypothetical protein